MESGSDWEIEKRLKRVDRIISGSELDAGGLRSRTRGVTAERLFTNQKVNDLVAKAETEQSDYRRPHQVNVFFGPQKIFFLGPRHWAWVWKHPLVLSVFTVNTLVIIGSSIGLLVIVYAILQRQLRTRGI
jgi:hypothetical protein